MRTVRERIAAALRAALDLEQQKLRLLDAAARAVPGSQMHDTLQAEVTSSLGTMERLASWESMLTPGSRRSARLVGAH